MNYNKYKNIDECLIDFKHIHSLNNIECKYCHKPDSMYGFSITCEHCSKNINTSNNKKLYVALNLLEIFNHYLNQLTFENKNEINERIKNVLSEIKFQKTTTNFKHLNKYLKDIKVVGNQNSLFIFFNKKWELNINEEKIDDLYKISENPSEIIIMCTALTGYINENVINNSENGFYSFLKRMFNFKK